VKAPRKKDGLQAAVIQALVDCVVAIVSAWYPNPIVCMLMAPRHEVGVCRIGSLGPLDRRAHPPRPIWLCVIGAWPTVITFGFATAAGGLLTTFVPSCVIPQIAVPSNSRFFWNYPVDFHWLV
jgi:hypothetical protein